MLKDTIDSKQMAANQDLRMHIDGFRVGPNEVHNFTTISTGADLPKNQSWCSGKYFIDKKNTKAFWILYCNAVKHNPANTFTITEIPDPFGPLRVDIDMKSSLEAHERQYTTNMLKSIVGFYQHEIKKIIPEEHFDDKYLWCIVLEKPAPRIENNEYYKDGFHLHFPHFICTEYVQETILRPVVAQSMIDCGMWDNFDLITPINKLIDEKIFNKPWMLYGSVNYKDKRSVPYLYNRWDNVKNPYGHAFNHNLDEVPMDYIFEQEMIGKKNKVGYYLPEFLSVRGYTNHVPFTKNIVDKSTKKTQYKKREIPAKRDITVVMSDLKEIRETFMDMLNDERSHETPSWNEVGWSLFGIGQGIEEALDIWIDFSKRSSKFKEGECEEKWSRFTMNDRTIGCVRKWAEIDNKKAYDLWKQTNIRAAMFTSLLEPHPTEYDVSRVADILRHDRYLCADPKRDLWFEFVGHRHREMPDGLALKKFLVEDVLRLYADLKLELRLKLAELDRKKDGGQGDEAQEIKQKEDYRNAELNVKRCSAIITALKTCSFLDKVVKMCKLHMHDPEFYKKKDENKKLLGFENGVLDLDLMCFREGNPDDYRTFSSELNFRTFNENDDEVKALDAYLEKVYPNANKRNYFLDFFATCYEGGNQNKRVLFMLGGKDGAKSMTTKLLESVFGSGETGYFGKFPRELLVQATGKTSSSGCRPELARVRGKRIMSCQEVTKGETLNMGFLKEASGNDSFFARNVYEKGTDINPQYTLIAQMNYMPSATDDDAFWGRNRILDHESTFVKSQDLKDNPVPESHEEQMKQRKFHADSDFAREIPELAQVLAWRLWERYKIYKSEENGGKCVLVEPDEVILATENQKTQLDMYKCFREARLEKVKDARLVPTTYISYTDLKAEFDDYKSEEYPSDRKAIGKADFIKIMAARLGQIGGSNLYGLGVKSRFYGWTIAENDEDKKDDDEAQDIQEDNGGTAPMNGKPVFVR